MIWNKYTIKTTTADADMVSAVLMDFGICDIEIENNVQLTDEELNQMYADFVKELPPDDGSCSIDFYVEFEDEKNAAAKNEELLDRIRQGLKDAEEMFGLEHMELTGEVVDSMDWENKWKAYFKPFMVDDIAIKPTWETLPEEMKGKTLIEIDPGMAFGTGKHETTKLCLQGLCKYLKNGDRIYDFGCGSGILAIAALKLGAAHAVGMDIDVQAVKVAEENFEVNGINKETFSLLTGNILCDDNLKQQFSADKRDIVVANILAEIIEPLTGEVDNYLRDGGLFIASGIIDNKETLIVDAVKNNPNLELVEVKRDGDWVMVVAEKGKK